LPFTARPRGWPSVRCSHHSFARSPRPYTRVTLRFVTRDRPWRDRLWRFCAVDPCGDVRSLGSHAQDGNDTEANVVIAALCVGLAASDVGTIAFGFAHCPSLSSSSRTHSRAFSNRICPLWVRFSLPSNQQSLPSAPRLVLTLNTAATRVEVCPPPSCTGGRIAKPIALGTSIRYQGRISMVRLDRRMVYVTHCVLSVTALP